MTDTRVEKDTMGSVCVPQDALYGAQTQRAVDNFDFASGRAFHSPARKMPLRFIAALAQVKKAAAETNKKLGALNEPAANAIIDACDCIIAGGYTDQFPVPVFQTGSGTSTNMNMNEVLATLARQRMETDAETAIHPNDHVNLGQSSNDVIPCSLQLALYQAVEEDLFPALDRAAGHLGLLTQSFQSVIKTGRTHLMDALPLALGDEMATWRHQLVESKDRILASLPRLAQLPLGGTAIGTGLNRHRDFADTVAQVLSGQTGLPLSPSENLASRISAQEPSLEVHGQMKVLATVLMKIANDLRWMNSGPNSGLAEIRLKAVQPGSSIMPAKVNPVIPEAIAMMCAEVIGNDVSVTLANQSGNFQLNVMLPLIADKCLGTVELLSAASIALDKALVDIVVNEERLHQLLTQNPILATALNTRIGYEKAAEIAKVAQREQRSVLEVAREMSGLDEEELERLLDPERLARPFAE